MSTSPAATGEVDANEQPTTPADSPSKLDAPLLTPRPPHVAPVPLLSNVLQASAEPAMTSPDALLARLGSLGVDIPAPASAASVAEIFAMLPDSEDMDQPAALPEIVAAPHPRVSQILAAIDRDPALNPQARPMSIVDSPAVAAAAAAVVNEVASSVGVPATTVQPTVGPSVLPKPAEPVAMQLSSSAQYQPSVSKSARSSISDSPTLAPPAAVVADDGKKSKKPKKSRRTKRKRHILRKLLVTAVVLGILGGGAFAAKTYLLGTAGWTDETSAIADDIELSTGLQFTSPIPLVVEGGAAYDTRRATALLALAGRDSADLAAEWRALGLLTGALNSADLARIGSTPAQYSSAFFDPESGEVVERAGAPDQLRVASLRHALTMGLMHQLLPPSPQWSVAGRIARQMYADSVADDVAAELHLLDSLEVQDRRNQQLLTLLSAGAGQPASPYAAFLLGNGDVLTAPAGPSVSLTEFIDDAQLYDVARGSTVATAQQPPAGGRVEGMMFWYHALAGRIDDQLAWAAATSWSTDLTMASVQGTQQCIDATITATDTVGAAVLQDAFAQWAAGAPRESSTTVAPAPQGVTVRACDPGAVATSSDAAVALQGGSVVEHAAVASAATAEPTLTTAQRRCIALEVRSRGLEFDAGTELQAVVDSCRTA